MKTYSVVFFFLAIAFFSFSVNAQIVLNGGMERIDHKTNLPVAWQNLIPGSYDYKLDSTIVKEGKYSVSIDHKRNGGEFGAISCVIQGAFKGSRLQLKGYIKTENVAGYAGFWVRIDGTTAFDNMAKQNIKGTTDWKEYAIDLPYNGETAININVGALLVGAGKMWFDDVKLYLDGKPIEQAGSRFIEVFKAQRDTAFSKRSGVNALTINTQTTKNLMLLGQVWGFVKYHLPAVAKGDINMDAELFRVMPAVIKAQNYQQVSAAIEQWLDKLGRPEVCKNCAIAVKAETVQKPDYGLIFNKEIVSASLLEKLTYILNNRNTGKNYYVDMVPGVGNPIFKNELAYADMAYPDAGYRLLSLFRYWNMIQYFAPYKNVIGQDWNGLLSKFIPRFVSAKNATEYDLVTLALIASINDTHANIWNSLPALLENRGKLSPPFAAKFVEDKLTVIGYYNDILQVKDNVKIGDVIIAINGIKVTELIKRNLPFTAASNYETQLRDIPRNSLLRGNEERFTYEIVRDKKTITVTQGNIERTKINFNALAPLRTDEPGYHLINDQVGYVYPGKYFNKDLPAIKKLFKDTKGIVIDMRCYPSEFMPFTFVPYIKSVKNDFVKFTFGSVVTPGQFVWSAPLTVPAIGEYKGKVVVIVNEISQSQAEYTTMAFQSSPNVTVIGSITAGADGNVSSIVLPGGISTMISGIGVFYPDGTPTQRKGVKIDEVVKPTIAGIKAGRDELLERAKEIIMK
jgi:hypothetical protein